MTDLPEPASEPDELSRLGSEIQKAQDQTKPDSARMPEGFEIGMRMVFELLGGLSVGGLIGWWLDGKFGTSPWLLLVCLMFGLAAGMVGLVRTAQRYNQ